MRVIGPNVVRSGRTHRGVNAHDRVRELHLVSEEIIQNKIVEDV